MATAKKAPAKKAAKKAPAKKAAKKVVKESGAEDISAKPIQEAHYRFGNHRTETIGNSKSKHFGSLHRGNR